MNHNLQPNKLWQRDESLRHQQHQATPHDNTPRQPARPLPQNANRTAVFTPTSAPAKSPARNTDKQRLSRDESEFSQLLNGEGSAAPLTPITPLSLIDPDALLSAPQEAQTVENPQAAALWQIVEPQLSQSLETQEAFPASFSMILPQLGEVKAQVNTLAGGGLDVALGFSPALFNVVRGSETACGENLSRRMSQRVRLRFKRWEALS
ncbi:type III secretion system HrpP C-terminal domain-containing protein [Paramixta manurensis]